MDDTKNRPYLFSFAITLVFFLFVSPSCFFSHLSIFSLYLFVKISSIQITKKDAKREDRLCLVETGLQQRTRSTRWDCRRFSSPHHNKLCRGPHKNHLVLISLIVERFFHRKLCRLCERNQNKPTERSILEAV